MLYFPPRNINRAGWFDFFLMQCHHNVSFPSAQCFVHEVDKQLEFLPCVIFVHLKSICHLAPSLPSCVFQAVKFARTCKWKCPSFQRHLTNASVRSRYMQNAWKLLLVMCFLIFSSTCTLKIDQFLSSRDYISWDSLWGGCHWVTLLLKSFQLPWKMWIDFFCSLQCCC